MDYTLAKEATGMKWSLFDFEKMHGKLSIMVGAGYNGQPSYYGIFDLDSNNNIVAYVSHSLRGDDKIDRDNIVVIVLSSGYYCVCLQSKKKELETIDLKAIFIEEHIVSRVGSESALDRTVSYCKENGLRHYVYINYTECVYGVIWEEDNVINVWGHDSDGNYKKIAVCQCKKLVKALSANRLY